LIEPPHGVTRLVLRDEFSHGGGVELTSADTETLASTSATATNSSGKAIAVFILPHTTSTMDVESTPIPSGGWR
jgi:hypothetical protein